MSLPFLPRQRANHMMLLVSQSNSHHPLSLPPVLFFLARIPSLPPLTCSLSRCRQEGLCHILQWPRSGCSYQSGLDDSDLSSQLLQGGGWCGGQHPLPDTQIQYNAFSINKMSSFQFYTFWNVGPDVRYRQILIMWKNTA